jgi:hypothetical protein
MPFHYPFGEIISPGDKIIFQQQRARVLFVKEGGRADYASGVQSSDWDWWPDEGIFLEFEDGNQMGYDSFCEHDGIELLNRERAA